MNLIHTAAAIVLVAIVITLAAFALVNLVNATTALGDRLQLIGSPHSQPRGEAVGPGHSHTDRKGRSTMKRTMTRIGIGAIPAKLRTQAAQAYAELLRKGYAPADIFYGITRTGRYRVGTTDGYSIALGGAA